MRPELSLELSFHFTVSPQFKLRWKPSFSTNRLPLLLFQHSSAKLGLFLELSFHLNFVGNTVSHRRSIHLSFSSL
jgi:hypothetical protein